MAITGKHGSIVEIDAVLCDLWIYRHISPTAIKCSQNTLAEIERKINETSNYTLTNCVSGPANAKPAYINRYATSVFPQRVEFAIDDNVADGELLFLSEESVLWP